MAHVIQMDMDNNLNAVGEQKISNGEHVVESKDKTYTKHELLHIWKYIAGKLPPTNALQVTLGRRPDDDEEKRKRKSSPKQQARSPTMGQAGPPSPSMVAGMPGIPMQYHPDANYLMNPMDLQFQQQMMMEQAYIHQQQLTANAAAAAAAGQALAPQTYFDPYLGAYVFAVDPMALDQMPLDGTMPLGGAGVQQDFSIPGTKSSVHGNTASRILLKGALEDTKERVGLSTQKSDDYWNNSNSRQTWSSNNRWSSPRNRETNWWGEKDDWEWSSTQRYNTYSEGVVTTGSKGRGKNGAGKGKNRKTEDVENNPDARPSERDRLSEKWVGPIDIERQGVTLMVKNIPNKYTRTMLIEQLYESWIYTGKINFLYMPIDFNTECNVGYCFLNFRSQELADEFTKLWNGMHTKKVLPGYNSAKIVSVGRATVQGLENNLERLKRSPLMPMLRQKPGWQPLLFDLEGNEILFPCDEAAQDVISRQARKSAGKFSQPPTPASRKTGTEGHMQNNTNWVVEAQNQEAKMRASEQLVAQQIRLTQSIYGGAVDNMGHLMVNMGDPTVYNPNYMQSNWDEAYNLGNNTNYYMDENVMCGTLSANGALNAGQLPGQLPPQITPIQQQPQMPQLGNVEYQEPHPGSPTEEADLQAKERLSNNKFVKLAEVSPTAQRYSNNLRSAVTRNQIESFFKPDTYIQMSFVDRALLRKNMDACGWIYLSTLMQLKNMYYPGHDLMRECLSESVVLELSPCKDMFRCQDLAFLSVWIHDFELEEAQRGNSKTTSLGR